ncbi:hypothetical protein LPJ56_000778 [Coemansia sp. RSA 2599]|nr:hypothetical protein LPJ75_000410 [Coemansia sp. RSA 2598]KAJ1828921.1 hypothetical protein LPJ56_000778 [Coemansia sp. RSA 2599]
MCEQEGGKGGRCSVFEFSDIKALLQKTRCISGKPVPGQRIWIQQAQDSPYHSILRKPDTQSTSSQHRRVKFDLPPSPFDPEFDDIPGNDDGSSDCTVSQDFGPDRYLGDANARGSGAAARKSERSAEDYLSSLKVQKIPLDCLEELIELGTLDRVMMCYTRDVGKLAIDSYRPFRSAYFYAIVLYHLSKTRTMDMAEISKICEAAVVLNNVSSPVVPTRDSQKDISNLLLFLEQGVVFRSNAVKDVDDKEVQTSRAQWASKDAETMNYAMDVGHQVAHLDQPVVKSLLAKFVDKRCIIRPIYHYQYREFISSRSTGLPVLDESLQFQIYSTVLELMQRSYKSQLPLSYVMFSTLFAIVETNELIVNQIIKSTSTGGNINVTVFNDHTDDMLSNVEEPVDEREQLSLLDWDFAAVIGHLLAYRFHTADQSLTNMRARLGALAFSVDVTKDQPFPPILPLQDTKFHQYIHKYVSTIYSRWPYGFVYMVIDEAVNAYNMIIQNVRSQQAKPE